jgi:hypothetical protein
MPGCEPRDERGTPEFDFIPVAKDAIDWMNLAAWPHVPQCRYVLFHRHDLSAGQLFDECISLHVVAMRMTADHDPDVAEAEAELLHGRSNDGDSGFEAAVDEDVAFRRRYEERRELLGSDVVKVADDPVRGKWTVPVHVPLAVDCGAGKDRERRAHESGWRAHDSSFETQSG